MKVRKIVTSSLFKKKKPPSVSFRTRLFLHRPFFFLFTVKPRLNVSPSNMSRRGVGRTAVHAGDLKKALRTKGEETPKREQCVWEREKESQAVGMEEISKVNGEPSRAPSLFNAARVPRDYPLASVRS